MRGRPALADRHRREHEHRHRHRLRAHLGGTLPGTTVEPSSSRGVDPTTATSAETTASQTATTSGTSTSDGTTAGTSSSSGGSDSGGETGIGEQGFGDCYDDPAMDVCLMGEACIDDGSMPPSVAVCALQDCGGAGACPVPPPGGNATTECMDVTGDMVDECVLQPGAPRRGAIAASESLVRGGD